MPDTDLHAELLAHVRDVPDFPKPGITFKDLTPLLGDARALGRAMDGLERLVDWNGVTTIAAIEARGFLLAGYLAARRRLGIVPVRKPGKLPWKTVTETYALEYGTDELAVHEDAFHGAGKVLILDDVLATGGTAAATAALVRRAGGEVSAAAFLIELAFLDGRSRLADLEVISVLRLGCGSESVG